MPLGHALARLKVIRPKHLDGMPFVSFDDESYTSQSIERVLEACNVKANVVLMASINPTVCHFVAAGLGVSLVHPLFIFGMEKALVARPFEPAMPFDFLLCFARAARNPRLIADFANEIKAMATRLSEEIKRS